MKPRAIIVDLDYTLVIPDPARNLYDCSDLSKDTLHGNIATLVKKAIDDNIFVHFVTARNKMYRKNTEKFLLANGFRFFSLHMNDQDVTVPASKVKGNIVLDSILPFWDVDYAIDDDSEVVHQYNMIGVAAFQANV